MNHLKIPLSLFYLLTVIFFSSQVLAAPASGNIYGFAWGGNNSDGGANSPSSIGWISFSGSDCGTCPSGTGGNCVGNGSNGCPSGSYANYGVTMTDDGSGSKAILDGYAWSDSLGWISFKTGDLTNCPSGYGPCKAWLDYGACPSNKCAFDGWAKVMSVNAGNAGGWDGWIHLKGVVGSSRYGVTVDPTTSKIDGFASSDWTDPTTGTVGWIEFKNIWAYTDFPFVPSLPTAKMACNAAGCPGSKVVCGCDVNGNNCAANWVMYQPIATPACNFQLKNLSTGQIDQSVWTIDAAHTLSCSGAGAKCDYGTIQSSIVPGDYTVSLTVQNGGGQDTATHPLKVLNDTHAGLMCSLNDHNWQACSSPSFAKSAGKGEKIYFRDDQTLANVGINYSWPSDGETIISREWTFNGTSIDPVDLNNVVQINGVEAFGTVTLQKNNTMTLSVKDSNGRTDVVTYKFDASFIPKWQEVSPIGAVWKNLLAGVFGIMSNLTR